MITKKLNFTLITGKKIVKNRSPDPKLPFDVDFVMEPFMFTVPRKLSYEAAIREVRKKFDVNDVVKDSVYIDYEQHEYSISIEDFIQCATLIK